MSANLNGEQQQRMISVIVPVGARRDEIGALYREYQRGIAALNMPYEFIFVLDGPRTDAAHALAALLRAGEDFTVVSLTRCFGEAAALMAGFERASGDYIVTLPAYHQIDCNEIGKLVHALQTADVAIAHREPRFGSPIDRARRATYHGLVRFVTGMRFRDLGCGARALRREVMTEIDLYGDQHRFISIIANRLGFRVAEVPVRQSPLDRRRRVYRPREYAHHVLDLFSIFFLVRFTKRPLRFFGMVGASTFGMGALLIVYLGAQRILFNEALADRPALLLAALLLVLGLQVFALGLLGELIIFTHARGMKDYRVDKVIHFPEAEAAPKESAAGIPSDPLDKRQAAPPAVIA